MVVITIAFIICQTLKQRIPLYYVILIKYINNPVHTYPCSSISEVITYNLCNMLKTTFGVQQELNEYSLCYLQIKKQKLRGDKQLAHVTQSEFNCNFLQFQGVNTVHYIEKQEGEAKEGMKYCQNSVGVKPSKMFMSLGKKNCNSTVILIPVRFLS